MKLLLPQNTWYIYTIVSGPVIIANNSNNNRCHFSPDFDSTCKKCLEAYDRFQTPMSIRNAEIDIGIYNTGDCTEINDCNDNVSRSPTMGNPEAISVSVSEYGKLGRSVNEILPYRSGISPKRGMISPTRNPPDKNSIPLY
ncbi:hypothetical protein [Halorubrum tebenquichense]|uniref:hypothetical protein n=1 Tax=Halorubrum tebenquichense TaxID=119434 RepID=UPI0012684439|nr:hypothetical protein [Halorubrum tebenquichense]